LQLGNQVLIIHIGYHKTGSTAIQSFLENNRAMLEESGVVIPTRLSRWLGHPEVAWSLDRKNYPWQDQHYDVMDIERHYQPWLDISLSPEKKVILSSEEFCRLEFDFSAIARLRNLVDHYKPVIIGYVRDPVDFLLSRYRHEVQMGSETRTLGDFLSNFDNLQSAAFHVRTRVWEQAFPESCIFRDFGGEYRGEGSIIRSFLKLIEYNGSVDDLASEDPEKKLNPIFIDAVRALVRSSLDDVRKGEVFDQIFHLGELISASSVDKNVDQLTLSHELRTLLGSLNASSVNISRTLTSILASRAVPGQMI
jgi:hypothetical protein